LPILKKYKYSATCFIVAGNIGGKNYWDLDKGVMEKKMMNEAQIKEWINQGMEIGSHSYTHSHLSRISSLEKVEKEIQKSKYLLEKKFGVKVKHFCYPYGDYSRNTIEVLKYSNYLTATTVKRGRVSNTSKLFELPRVLVNHRTYPVSLLLKIFTNYEDGR